MTNVRPKPAPAAYQPCKPKGERLRAAAAATPARQHRKSQTFQSRAKADERELSAKFRTGTAVSEDSVNWDSDGCGSGKVRFMRPFNAGCRNSASMDFKSPQTRHL